MRKTHKRDTDALSDPSIQSASRDSATMGSGDAGGADARVLRSCDHAGRARVRNMAPSSTQGSPLDIVRDAESKGVVSSATCPLARARVAPIANAVRLTDFARGSKARSTRADRRDRAPSISADSSASSAHSDSVCAVKSAATEMCAEERASSIRDAQMPTKVELQRAELRERALLPTAPLDRYLQSQPSDLCDSFRRSIALALGHDDDHVVIVARSSSHCNQRVGACVRA